MAPHHHDIEARAADENSPLLIGDIRSHGTMRSTTTTASTSSVSISTASSVTATEGDNDNADSVAPPKGSEAKQNVAAMLCLLMIGMTPHPRQRPLAHVPCVVLLYRSEERRVGKECPV